MVGAEDGPVLHKHLWPLPPDGMLLEPEPEPEAVWRLDMEPAPRTSALATSISSAVPSKVTEQVWPLLPRDQPMRDLDDVSAIFDPDAIPGSVGALPGSRGSGSRTYDTWLDHSNSAIFLNELLGSPGGRRSSGPARAQTPDLGPPRTAALSTLQRVERQRPSSSNKPRATEQGERPWTSERFENLVSASRAVRGVGTTTGSLQMSVPLENELRRTAMDYVSRKLVRRKVAAQKRLGSRLEQAPHTGVAFGSTVGGSMRWTAQRSSNSQCSVVSVASSSQGSIGSPSVRRATTPVGGLAGQSGTLPGPSAGWLLPLSPHSDDESSPGRDNLRSRGPAGSSITATAEREIHTKRPVLVQASEPQLSGRTGRQSPRHNASVRYVKSPRENQQGSGRDPSRSHLFGKGVGQVWRYRVLDKVIEVHAEPAPETPALPPAHGTSIQATQTGLTQTPGAGRPGLETEQANDTSHLRSEWQRQSRVETPVTSAAAAAWAKCAQHPRRRQQRRHLGQRPLPGQFAPGAVILDDFRSLGRRPVMVQLAQRKHK
jgi:hypothetical protein